jgi:ATP-binding cassette subfamily B protein
VLDGLDLTIPARRSLAIVGQNGAGKMTLAKLLCRVYEPTDGRITVDGVDLASLVVGVLARPACGRVPGLLPLRVRRAHVDRVGDLARVDDDAVVLAAVGRAGATDVLEHMPRGLDTQLGLTWHAGVELSIGQWQKIAFARGFMRDRPLLCVLDEPTAALDAETEHALYEHFTRHHARRAKTEESRFSSHIVSRRCAWPTRSSCTTGRAWSSTATTTR